MLRIWRKKEHAIGIDLGSSSLKIVQLETTNQKLRLVAMAQTGVPQDIRSDTAALHEWYITNVREQLAYNNFKGKKIVSCLPSRDMLIQHLRVPKMDEKQLSKAIGWEAQDKLPFDINNALLRHVVAGEVYQGDENKLEVILMAAPQHAVQRHLNLLERTKCEINSIHVEPWALVNCFTHLFHSNDESDNAGMFVDLGHDSTKVVISHGTDMALCRTINIGAPEIGSNPQNAEENISEQPQPTNDILNGKSDSTTPARNINPGSESSATMVMAEKTHNAGIDSEKTKLLCEEIRGCVRYHDLTFTGLPVKKVIFLGGRAKNKALCRSLAQHIGLSAQIGDPVAKINLEGSKHIEIDPQEINSEWAVAFGLSLNN